MSDTTTDLVEREWTFLYRYVNRSGKLVGLWRDHNAEDRVYEVLPRHVTAGTVWRVRCSPDGTSAAIKTAVYTGRHVENDDDHTRWSILDQMAKVEKQRASELRKLGDVETIDEMSIRDVRTALRHAHSYAGRAALVGLVLERLGVA
jgi:hypothetical protein